MKNKLKINFNDTRYIYGLAGMVFLAGLLLAGWFFYQSFSANRGKFIVNNEGEKNFKENAEKDCDYKRKLDGVCVEAEKYISSRIVAVMVENNLEAWPLSGIAKANIVYEAPVEGNIPRFLAVYASDSEVEQVGPVRSARPYYLDWVSEYGNPMYMHVGGSDDALNLIDRYNLFDMNEFSRGWYFWRDENRKAPHNTYTSSKLWNKAIADYGEYNLTEDYNGWLYEKIVSCADDCIQIIEVPIAPTGPYKAVWKFNTTTEQYIRFQNTKQEFDLDGKEIAVDTIIVQKVKSKIADEAGRRKIDTIGGGEAFVFRNGLVFEGQWIKESQKDRTKFYDKDGKIIPLKAGKIWVEILPEERELKWAL